MRRTIFQVVGQNVLHQFERAFAQFGTCLQIDHERPACLHRAEAGVDAVGQAAFLAYFSHQARAEATATEDAVTQCECGIVRIVAVNAQLGQQQVGLLGRKFDVGFASLGFGGLYGFGDCRAFRQRGGYLSGDGLGFCARQIANDRDHRVAGGVSLVVERLELIDGHRSDALSGAIAGVGVRVIAVQTLEQFIAGQLARVLLLVFKAGEQLVFDPCQGVGRKGWLANNFGKQVERWCALGRVTQAAQ